MTWRDASPELEVEAVHVAGEHARWCQQAGHTPLQVIASLGEFNIGRPRWDDVVRELARAWLGLQVAV